MLISMLTQTQIKNPIIQRGIAKLHTEKMYFYQFIQSVYYKNNERNGKPQAQVTFIYFTIFFHMYQIFQKKRSS